VPWAIHTPPTAHKTTPVMPRGHTSPTVLLPGRSLSPMSTYADEISAAYAALNDGDVQPFRELLAPEAQWLGTGDHSWDGTTPT
jgi:hypothetical protein